MSKQSPLKDLHRANGAAFVEEEGWMLPLHFGDPLAEYRAVRSHVGILDLCDRGLLCFTGPDRVSYLQGMVSNDVKKLAPGQGLFAAVLDIQGKILADTRIICAADGFVMEVWEPLKDKIVAHLNRYLIADEVEITDLTGQYTLLSLQGPKSDLLLRDLLPNEGLPAEQLAHRIVRLHGMETQLIRATHTGEEGYDFIVARKDLLPIVSLVEERGRGFSLAWVGMEAREILRIEAGILRYGVDMSEDNLLLETGLDHAVSFQKGCYLGQEVVERIRSRGHVNKKLSGLRLDGETAARSGSSVRADGKEIGKVTSSVLSPAQKRPLALGYLQRDYWEPGTQVTIESEGNTIAATVSSLPFYSAAGSLECR